MRPPHPGRAAALSRRATLASGGPAALSDESLLAGLADCDPETARELVRRYQGRVYGLAVGLLRDPAAAEDIAQETFIRVWRHSESYDARRGTVAAWLLRITRNLAIDTLRLRRAELVDPGRLAGLGLAAAGTGVEEAAVNARSADDVRAALRALPVEQSRAVLLAAYLGHTAEEISQTEGIPLGTAKTRVRLALRKLRAELVERPELSAVGRPEPSAVERPELSGMVP